MIPVSADVRGPSIAFWGAARSVTGSMHLVEAGGYRILLDCGLVRGPRGHAHPPGEHFPFSPTDINAVIISHAHIDHCGNLGTLIAGGFTGPIYATRATRDLLRVVLRYSARIQEEDAFVRSVVGGDGDAEPPFTREDVDQGLAHCVGLDYDEFREIAPGIELRLANAGHILGSAMVHLTIRNKGGSRTLLFTGDLGRRSPLLLHEPAPLPRADLVISESTYGGRYVESAATATAALEDIVRRTAERDGKILIPAFSLGRTQAVVDVLVRAIQSGRLAPLPVYVAGSLATDLAEVHRRHAGCLQEGAADRLQSDPTVRYLASHEQSQEASTRRDSCVIIAPSGMCEGGRILHHLKENLDDPRCSVVLVNYQAPHTLGHRLLERGPVVRIHGQRRNKWADIVYLAGFSGHADHEDLLAALTPLAAWNPAVRLVHGEPQEAMALAAALRERGLREVAVPERGERFSFADGAR